MHFELADSLEEYSDGNRVPEDLPAGPSRVTPTKKEEERQKTKMEQKW